MIEAFANESETANIETESNGTHSRSYLLNDDKTRHVKSEDIVNIAFFTNREDGSRLISPSPTAHTPGYYWRGRTFQTTNRAT